ncbi:MAG: hypothetical protein ACI4VF_10245, partial [Lachnospirales bacterium]
IKKLIGGETSQKYICKYLNVRKPTASVALKNLEKDGYILKEEKAGINEYYLTEKSWKIINSIEKEKFEFMSLFNNYFGIDYNICEKEYERVCGGFSKDFINILSNIREDKYLKNKKDENISDIPIGKYEIPFRVLNLNDDTPSMGDRGFIHPALLVAENNKRDIILKSKQMYYKSKDDKMLKGSLKELYYYDSNFQWVLAKENKDNNWVIPIDKIMCQKDSFGRISIGILKIKVKATTKKMPESVAKITFNFKMIKKL